MISRRRELLAASETQWYLIGRFTCTVTFNNSTGYSDTVYLWSVEPRSAFVGSNSTYLIRSGWEGPGIDTKSSITVIKRSDSTQAEIVQITSEDVPPTNTNVFSGDSFFYESAATYTSGFGFTNSQVTRVSSLDAYYLNSDTLLTGSVNMNCQDMNGSGSTNNQICPKDGKAHNWELQLNTATTCPYEGESVSLHDYKCSKCGRTTRWYNCGHGGAIGEY